MSAFDITKRPANWLRCVALVGHNKDATNGPAKLKATGVVFPDGIVVVHWSSVEVGLYPDEQDAVNAAASHGYYTVKFLDIEVPLQ